MFHAARKMMIDFMGRRTREIRLKRMQHFLRIMKPSSQDIILDVGGLPDLWVQCGYKGQIVFLNLENPEIYRAIPPNSCYIQGDGRCLNFPDKSFDIVFSNSVIEHVGDLEEQRAFARETSRVGKRYWIETPNKNFPIEPHFNFPLFQFLPLSICDWIASFWPFSWFKLWGQLNAKNVKDIVRSIRLLGIDEMQALYPDGKLFYEDLFGFLKCIVAYRC